MASVQMGMVDDLATLSELTESMLLDEIQARYQKGIIYTYIGDILLSVNPYKKLDIYSTEVLKAYTHVTMKRQLPPHIFSISDQSYVDMFRSGENQCCVVCGESGSGKTETTKLLIKHIVQICDQHTNGLLNRIIEINPLLEAFGNARTVMNDNSSRFGKYIELQFDLDGKITGANVSDYLLEKSRVIQQAPGERNFHIFYYMFAGVDLNKLQINLLDKPEDHRILRPSDGSDVFGESDYFSQTVEMWKKTQRILDLIGFTSAEKESITAMLTAVIHITDIRFLHDSDTDGSYIENEERLEMAAILLGIELDQLGAALTTTETTIPGQTEKIVILKNVYQAADGRDALAKTLYGRMFGWIVRQINHILGPGSSGQTQHVSGSVQTPTIGILDIYGFENFKTNSFEQLCINIANEQIHYYFTKYIFKMELDEYAQEGIKGKNIQFDDNKHIVDLFFEANGLYDLLDEESKFPRANDLTLIEKLEKTFLKRPEFERPRTQNLQFVIQHYAGPVSYCVSGFLEKNRDFLSVNLLDCMKKSGSLFVADLFSASISDTGSLNDNDPRPSSNRRRNIRSILLCKPLAESVVKESRTKKIVKDKSIKRPTSDENRGSISKTLTGYFKNSLVKLLEKMISAQPHFVRCIRPNAMKQSDTFNKELVLKQLRYTGVVQTVTIRRQGYATRLTFRDFLNRYKFIVFPLLSQVEPGPNNCTRVLLQAGIEKYEIGKTKVFLKYYHTEQLDAVMLATVSKVVTFQKYSRGILARKLYEGMKEDMHAERASQLSSTCQYVSQLSGSTTEILHQLHELDKAQKCPNPPTIPRRTVKRSTETSLDKQSMAGRNSAVNNSALEIMLEEAMSTLQDVDIVFWGKLHFLSNNTALQKFLLRDLRIVLDGSNTQYNGTTIGMMAHASEFINQEALQEIGKGVEITRDETGDIFIKKLGSCDVIIKGYRDETNNCLSDEVIQAMGRLGSERIRVFDIQKFKKHIATELRQAVINIPRIETLSMISFSFICDSMPLDVSIAIINFSALDLLGDLQVLSELKQMAGLRLSHQDDLYLQNTWLQMQRRKPSVKQGMGSPGPMKPQN